MAGPIQSPDKCEKKRLSQIAQNHYGDLEDTCRDKVTNFGVIVRYIKKVIEKKNKGWGQM